MPIAAAPRIDDRLRRFIAGTPPTETAAELTRRVGDLAEELRLPRPSYQQVRVLFREGQAVKAPLKLRAPTAMEVLKVLDRLYEYPGPFLGDWYKRYVRGGGL